MLSSDITKLANLDHTLDDLDLNLLLWSMVMPEFLSDVGHARWRNAVATMTITAAVRQMDLPDDFHSMLDFRIPGTGQQPSSCPSLKYIQEDIPAMLDAEATTTPSKPGAYWIAARSGDSSFRAVRFNRISDQAYSAFYAYRRGPAVADVQSPVNMDTWIPALLQPGLVLCLRRYGLEDRVGESDGRYQLADTRYQTWVEKIIADNADLGKQNFAVFAK